MVASVLLSRVVGFVREAVIAAQQGATGNTDAYFAAFTLPDLLNYFLAGGTLSITFIPLFSKYLAQGDEEGGWRLFSTVANAVGGLVLVAVVVGEIVAPWAVPALNPGFDEEQVALCVNMTRIVLPGMFCFTVGGLLQATLLAKERFGWVATIPIVYNVCIILGGVLLGPIVGVAGFAWGALAGAIIGPLAIPLIASRKTIRYRLVMDLRSEGFISYVKLALPLMFGVTLVSLDEWLLRYFGSYDEGGAVSYLNNARRLMLVPFAVIGQAASQAALPFLSRLAAENKRDELASTLTTAMKTVVFYAVLSAGAMIVLAQPVVWFVYRRGAFTADDATSTSVLLALFSLGIGAWSVQSLAARGYYALSNTLEPMLIGTVVVVVVVPIYALLHEAMSTPGLALASSIGITLNATVFVLVYRWRHAPIGVVSLLVSGLKAILLAAAAGGATWWVAELVRPWLSADSQLGAVVYLVVGGAMYFSIALGAAALLRFEELAFLRRQLARVTARIRSRR